MMFGQGVAAINIVYMLFFVLFSLVLLHLIKKVLTFPSQRTSTFKLRALVFFACLLIPGSALSEMIIENVYQDGDYLFAVVSYVNDTEETYRSVTVQCSALGKDKKTINLNKRFFFSYQLGPLGPGFSGTVKIPINTYGQSADSASCTIIPAK